MVLVWLAGCTTTSQQPSGRIADVTEARATVTAIDLPRRLVTLKEETGEEFVAEVAPAVANLNEVKVGDQIVVSYTKSVAWQVRPAGQDAPAFSAEPATTSSASGDKLKGSVGGSVSLTATIAAIDTAQGTVTLKWEDGNSDTIKARDPANLKKVRVGDVVDIVYSEAIAVAVRPASK
jgi:hypothetical protein